MLSDKYQLRKVSINKKNNSEKGAAMAIAVIVVAILLVIALTALAFSSSEARTAGADLQRTHAFYAAAAGMEKMTNDFSNLFRKKMNPTTDDLIKIADAPPTELKNENFTFTQTIEEDTERLNELRTIQGLPNNLYPRVNIPDGPYAGLYASIIPYKMSSTALQTYSKAEVKLERDFNNYLVPLFQFGMFSNEDIEIHPGPLMTFDGRIHTNQNLYALRNTRFLNKVTVAGEFVRDATRGGEPNTADGNQNIYFEVNGINVQSTLGNGSVKSGLGKVGGPNLVGNVVGENLLGLRGFFPGSPEGIINSSWEGDSVKPAKANTPNRFGGQILTKTTGTSSLKLPVETGGNNAAELIKRSLTSDDEILSSSRYHSKAEIRILIDDLNAGNGTDNVGGIPAGKGVVLKNDASGFNPLPLANGSVLRRIANNGSYLDTSPILQVKSPTDPTKTETAMTVRGIKNITAQTAAGNQIPQGAGIEGRIYIEVVKPDGTTLDVTQTILSMGMTEGEPNGIVYLQRPMWAAFVQGSRDRADKDFDLMTLTRNYQTIADGEIKPFATSAFAANRGYLSMTATSANEDSGTVTRNYAPINEYDSIVPINVYNVREGWVRSSLSEYEIYDRGLMSVVELNMRNLSRWLDGVYDNNLLAGTNAVSSNIRDVEGYVVYVSDRRGDQVNTEYLSNGTAYKSTNGIVDNEDIYGPNGALDAGEDVIDFGWSAGGLSKKGKLQKDIRELPDSGTIGIKPAASAPVTDRLTRAKEVLKKQTKYFRRAVRLFDGETLSITGTGNKLSPTKGITVSSENLVHIWGNYNTTGITVLPADDSTLNNGGYSGAQIPASIVCDAVSPLSKTWFDALSILYPEGSSDARNLGGEPYRAADESMSSITESTSVRAAIIAGTTISALTQTPGKDAEGLRRNGGVINYPRFLEMWNYRKNSTNYTQPWNYSGSLVPLYRSTQAVGQWENDTSITYLPPRRNWSFDETYLSPQKLPPGTPFFQYVQATGFRQKLF